MMQDNEMLNQIKSADADAFSFVDVAGSFIQNSTFANGFRKFQNGEPELHESFIYQVLSSASNDIGQTIYDNVKRYINYIADVDVCRVKSLKSMLNLFGFKYTIFDELSQIPPEILNLIDTLSISRKFLLRDGWLKSEFIDLLSSNDVVVGDALEDSIIDIRHMFMRNAYILSACPCLSSTHDVNKNKILGAYVQQKTKEMLSGTSLSNWIGTDGKLSSTAIFKNNYDYLLVDQLSSYNLYDRDQHLILKFPEADINLLSSTGSSGHYQLNTLSGDDEEDLELSSSEFIKINRDQYLDIQLTSFFKEDVTIFDDDLYQKFLEGVYFNVISSYVALPYNLTLLKDKKLTAALIYPDLGSDYYKSYTSLRDYKSFDEDEMLSVKTFYHVPRGFDQRGIVDAIEVGDDELDNYCGAELSILNYEIQRRNSQVDLSTLTSRGYNSGNARRLQTRATYYRKQKVLEYARFVDNYYSDTAKNPSIYDVDPNYYVVSSNVSQISTVIPLNPVGNPSIDINYRMIHDVAHHLATLTTYIQKIREKIKQQTQKNYMKGTNLLLIYIINEYLIDYAKHNQTKLAAAGLSGIYAKLSAHQFKESEDSERYTINPVEFYDETNYTNISAATSRLAKFSSNINNRYWISTNPESKGLLKDDGQSFTIDQIEKFYLSTLNLNSKLSGNLPNFLSTIFDLGADPTFIYNLSSDSSLSIFSSKLSSGTFAHELFEELNTLSSSWLAYRDWLSDDYEYKDGDIALAQLSDSLQNSIFQGLSTKYLATVSDAYNANIESLTTLSSSVDALSSEYYTFITSDYSFYYKKFDSKYCYDGYDLDAGTYLHPWYVDSGYDHPEMTLYEHLYQLDRYSNGSNIVNWALSDVIAYVDSGFNQIYGSLRSSVISKITKLGFVDINALTLDNELTYTYDFLNNLITSRKEFLKNQLASIQQQASNLKTQYESLNNTFTNAVASFSDGNDGYNLGDDKIYAVSVTEARGFDGQCSRDENKPRRRVNLFCINVVGRWYYDDDNGKYSYEVQNISPVYNASGTLRQKCAAVKAYMSTPTHFALIGDQAQYFYGLQNEGIAAVADNTEAALDNLNDAYDNIRGVASNLFGISISSGSSDLYNNILSLIEQLIAIDETFFDDDENVSSYKGYLKTVISLSSQYMPVKEAYDNIFKSSELGSYMMNFTPTSDLTQENIQSLRRYLRKTDTSNLETIRDQIAKFHQTFDQLLETKDSIELCMYNHGVSNVTFTNGNMIEQYVFNLYENLLNDVAKKTFAANAIIDSRKNIIQRYADIISNEISADLDSEDGLSSVVGEYLVRLNFFEHENYQMYKEMFLTYGGQNFCYDPYYNMQNTVHPSYQLHPYLWNFVRKINTDSLIQSGYQAKAVSELEEDLINSYISKYLNPQGMPIDLWVNANKGIVDYTGYLSRYEMSENFSPATGFQNEVVDYDGAFYPPAISAFRSNREVCINSVSAEMTKAKCLVLASNVLPEEISTLLSVENTAEKTIISETIHSTVSKILTSWIDITDKDLKISIDNVVVGQPLSSVSNASVVNILNSQLPNTFFEKYYKHLDLPTTEYQRIASQLEEYHTKIVDITDPKPVTDVYDIYKYGLDVNGNSYILYKKYDYSSVEELKDFSFVQKRNTLGEIWVRLANHPIAFPAFSGKNPAYYLQNPRLVNMSILSVAAKEDPNSIVWADEDHLEISQISSDMRMFYDFEMSKSKSSIAYVAFNADYPFIDAYKRFDIPWVIGSEIQTYYNQITDIEWLQILNEGGSGIERIDFNYNSSLGQYSVDLDALQTSAANYPALIGYYPLEDSGIDFIYIEKEFGISGELNSDFQLSAAMLSIPMMFAVKIQNGTTYLKTNEQVMSEIVDSSNQLIVGDSACVGYDNDQEQMFLAVTTKTIAAKSDVLDTCTTSGEVDFAENADGPLIDDPLGFEMNSHDYFNQNVTIAKFRRRSAQFQFKDATVHNINADISYIPSYPALSNEAKIYAKWPDDEWHNVELLGMSKDIDDAIKLVNPSPNPYLDYEAIVNDTSYGRVYEDYDASEDKTFKMISNPSLNPNSPRNCNGLQVSYKDGDNYLEYAIPLAEISRRDGSQYSEKDYNNLKILVYNKMTLGKEPYLICDLKTLAGQTKELAYSDPDSELGEVSVIVPESERNEYYAVGTPNSFSMKTKSDSNRFKNISKITISFDDSSPAKTLSIKFYLQDKSFPFFIPEGHFVVLLHNPYDLTMFKYYHLFDAYGAVNCGFLATRPELLGIPDDGRGWGIYYDPSKMNLDKYLDNTKSFVVDDAGLTTFLEDIELSDYSYLSDVYVLSGYKGLGFKYDEELRFAVSSDLYYYPTMNLSYPKQAADYVKDGKLISDSSSGILSVLKSIYDGTNLFVVDLDDPIKIADKLGRVAVPVIVNDIDDVRAYEDWLDTSSFISTYIEDGIETSCSVDLKFSEIYDSNDPRAFQWLRYVSEVKSIDSEITSNGYSRAATFDIDDSVWQHTTANEFINRVQVEYNLVPTTSEELTSDYQSEYVFVDMNSSTVDLARMLKLYVNYKRNQDNGTLDLYFNYFNWFDSPYVKIVENKTYIDTIPGTYLKLAAGEDGTLDIIIQVKYYNGTQLYGYKNIKVLGYHIWNLSDDKPKFLIQKTYELSKDSQGIDLQDPVAMVNLNSMSIALDDYEASEYPSIPLWITIASNVQLSSECEFYLNYPADVLSCQAGTYGVVEVQDDPDGVAGLSKVHMYSTDVKSFSLPFKSILKTSDLITNYRNTGIYIMVDEPTFYDTDRRVCDVDFNDCTVTFRTNSIADPE